jgi:hypothetical protein
MAGGHTARRLERYDEDCITLATKKNSVLHSLTPTTAASKNAEGGWDPFEVWRTRVLLPRLAQAREPRVATTATPVPLVRRTPVVE